ncbi:MAG: biopolymer transporter ExbD [Deltaproteobacteria bacterium]|nr:biopolymer transporter ExbD [Deltaproteobacteria bacterium]
MKLNFEQQGARIELIPLIDIIFLLLVFFIYSMLSMVVYRGIPVDLPRANTTEAQQGALLVITIDGRGRIFVDQEPVEADRLSERLKAVAAGPSKKAVVISGHRDAPYRAFVEVLDGVRRAGFERVSIEAAPKGKGRSSGNP